MGSISQTNYELTIQISVHMYYSYLKDDYQIRCQFCSHSSSVVTKCAKLWPEWISRIHNKAKSMFSGFQLWTQKINCEMGPSQFLTDSNPDGQPSPPRTSNSKCIRQRVQSLIFPGYLQSRLMKFSWNTNQVLLCKSVVTFWQKYGRQKDNSLFSHI